MADEEILTDVRVFWIDGHVQRSQTVAVNTKKGTIIITRRTRYSPTRTSLELV
jgi:hypothetical protein